jgi:adenylate cyclase
MWIKLRQQIWEWRGLWLMAPMVAGVMVALRFSGWLQPLEWAALDLAFRLRPPEAPDSRIVIVGIDEDDLRQLRKWPIPDRVLAQLLTQVKQQQPRAIGLDLYRDLPVEPGHRDLTALFETTPNLIGIEKKVGDATSTAVAPPPVLSQRGQVGVNDIVTDSDGKIRRGLIYWTSDAGEAQESLGLRLALIYLEAQGILPEAASENSDYLRLGKGTFPIFEPNDGAYVRADAGGYQILLNFRGPANTFQIVSATDVLQGKLPANWARDRIVLVGPTATSLKDLFYTPYSGQSLLSPEKMAGVEIQANLASQIISAALDDRPVIRTWSEPLEIAWIFVWAGVGMLASSFFRMPRWAILSVTLAEASLIISCLVLFWQGWWIPLVPPALALAGSAIAVTGYLANQEREERQVVMNLFGRHVTPEIAEAIWHNRDQLLKEGRLLGQRMTATVLFSDLKDFTHIAEQTNPEVLMSWLNEYMDAMSQIVLEHGGIVDKFIGDAIMAVFGVPIPRSTPEAIAIDAQMAVSCALKMATMLQTLNQQWQAQGLPTTAMRVGISTGTVVTGSLGGRYRLDYTTIGDSVNVAARLESYNKAIDGGICRILINEETYQHSQSRFPMQTVGSVQLKGREQPTKIYQVLLEPAQGVTKISDQE